MINELNRVYPDFLKKRHDILFKLLVFLSLPLFLVNYYTQSQKFVEMIKHAPIEDTMVFGRTELYNFEKESPKYKKDLEVFPLSFSPCSIFSLPRSLLTFTCLGGLFFVGICRSTQEPDVIFIR